jgi:tryptophan-rich sensory protein
MNVLLPIFVLIPLVGGSLSGLLSMGFDQRNFQTWYDGLKKAPWNPPKWVFGPVWTLLYLAMGYASFRVLESPMPLRWTALGIYWANLVINFTWTPVFFGLKKPRWALYIISLLWCFIVATLVLFLLVDPLAGGLIVPYLLWATYAFTLNFYIVMNNDLSSSHPRRE